MRLYPNSRNVTNKLRGFSPQANYTEPRINVRTYGIREMRINTAYE
jgi:hypothetical protein